MNMRYFIVILSILIVTCDNPNEPEVFGCMDQVACNYNYNANIVDNNSCIYNDCTGECGGFAEIDECGICNGDGISVGKCDCEDNILDQCGVCGGDNSLCTDCAGEINGLATEDNCGSCDTDPTNDCNLDECGIYGGDNSTCTDCLGVINGDASIDECGICDGDGIPSWACDCNQNVLDCAGVCNGNSTFDECGVCDNNSNNNCNCNLNWELVWEDDFNVETINLNDWNFEVWGPGQFNNEKQAYTASTNNAYINDGNLVMKAMREKLDLDNDGVPDPEYTSARLTTQNKRYYVYENDCAECDGGKVKVEVRAKLPTATGTWPAIWMMPNNSEYGGWPNSGEIDIMEHVGTDVNNVHSSVHNATNSGNLNGTDQTANIIINDVENTYHTYGLIWSDEEILTFVDNESNIILDYDNSLEYDYELWPYNKDFFLILNLAIGGDWGGPNIDNDKFPQHMYIDYVKFYKLRCQQ